MHSDYCKYNTTGSIVTICKLLEMLATKGIRIVHVIQFIILMFSQAERCI